MLRIEITKRHDGVSVLHCTRENGSVTYQRQPARHAAHFVFHDLTHFAVETELGYQQGFFGLVAEGWDLEDTTGKTARGPLPPEALIVEKIVGLFDSERGSGTLWTLAEYNTFSPQQLNEDQLHRVRARRSELFQQWTGIEPGGKLMLEYAQPAAAALG